MTEDLGKPTGGDGILTPVKCLLNINGSISFSPIRYTYNIEGDMNKRNPFNALIVIF